MSSITNKQNIQAWDEGSDFILEKFTDEGDFYRQHIVNPALFSLLGNVSGKKIFDAGCGQGYLSRMLAKKGAVVTGLEPATGLITYAKEREEKEHLGITYIQEDLSVWQEHRNEFDSVISNMVFMDIPDWQSAMKNCIQVLKPQGTFVFSLSHPCFEYVEKDHEDAKDFRHAPDWQDQPYIKVGEYFEEYTVKNFIGYSFHHTLSQYINFILDNGCSLKKLVEPQMPEEIAKQYRQHERDFHVPSFLLVKAVRESL